MVMAMDSLCRTDSLLTETNSATLTFAILSTDSYKDRRRLLNEILPFHEEVILNQIRVLAGKEVSFRLLDMSLRNYIPKKKDKHYSDILESIANFFDLTKEAAEHRLEDIENTHTDRGDGFRGSALSIVYPEVTAMQVKAIAGKHTQITVVIYRQPSDPSMYRSCYPSAVRGPWLSQPRHIHPNGHRRGRN